MTIEEQLAAANARITSLEGDLTAANDLLGETQGHVAAATTRAETAEANAARLTGELGTATANLSAVTCERDTARGEVAAFTGAISAGGHFSMAADKKSISLTTTGVNHFLAAHLAATGHAPLPIGGGSGVDNASSAKADDKDPDAIRERAVAATNAQVAGYLATHTNSK